MPIRQPIVAVLGHVDHGKTSLLDRIRGTTVAAKEAGHITQHSGASEIPVEAIKKTCGPLLDKMGIKLEIPGLLMLDTPGHEAFTTIRKRGSSIADLAILVIDVNEGFQPQTDEALQFLKEFKTPFIVAATKIDKTQGWKQYEGAAFSDSFAKQAEHVRDSLDGALYKLVGQLSERGFDAERFDRVKDFKKMVAIVPVSSLSGEGFPELLVMLSGLAQTFLKGSLEMEAGEGKGSILEIREATGLGITADIILFDGEIRKGDWLIVGGREPFATKIRGLLKPKPLKEIRVEREFEHVDKVTAAAGVKIFAPDLDKAVAGSPIRAVRTDAEVEKAKKELAAEVEEVEFETASDGIIVRADTLGRLEALAHIVGNKGIPVRKAEVGAPTRKDIMETESQDDRMKKVILVFNVPVAADILREASDKGINIINSNIIYRLFEEYDKWTHEVSEKMREEKLASITKPGVIKLLPGFVFRANNPAVVGVEVMAGEIKPGVRLLKHGSEVGTIKEIQQESVTKEKAGRGDRVAVSIDGPTVGRQIKEGDELTVSITYNDLNVLEELGLHEEAALARKLLGKD
jgi:translation initiation factor 5B